MDDKVFEIFSWRTPFLPQLKDYIMELTDGHPGRAVLVTPNRRPERYLYNLFAGDGKACILPRLITISDMVTLWRAEFCDVPMRVANMLDQVQLLHECVQEEAKDNPLLGEHFLGKDMASFFPWAVRLAKVQEDFNVEGQPLGDLPNMEGEVSPPAAAILSSLRSLGRIFDMKLAERGWTTTGHDHLLALRNKDNVPHILAPDENHPVLIAGFHILNGVHDELLHALWQNGAKICLHTDPALASGANHHSSVKNHADWMRKWRARAILHAPLSISALDAPQYEFFAGFDLHSQLEHMRKLLEQENQGSTAIILGKPETLMATLQNLPEVNVNVSLGYPMERSSLVNLVEDLLNLGKNSPSPHVYRSADILKIIRHPFLSMLEFENTGKKEHLFHSLHSLDYEIRKSGRYWHAGLPVKNEKSALAARHIASLAIPFTEIDSLAKMAAALDFLINFLKEHGGKPWAARFPLDAESLFRLENEIVPILRNNLLANEKFPFDILSDILSGLIREERIPFEADPIEGLQILGLLESRLLHFDNLIFLDATDDVLPGSNSQDPLLPDSLRSLLGLPDNQRREDGLAYNMHRLVQGAKNVHFLWQEGTAKASSDGGKRICSRFMERLIWEKEKANIQRFRNGESLVEHPVAKIHINLKQTQGLLKPPAIQQAIDRFWGKTVFVTELDDYLKCPLKFMRAKILGLEGDKRSALAVPVEVGNFIHLILKDIYSPGDHLELKGENDPIDFRKRIQASFKKIVQEGNFEEKFSPDVLLTLESTIPLRLLEYREKQPECSFIVDVEKNFSASLAVNGRQVNFSGKFDRLDQRDNRLYISDYKTGKYLPQNNPEFWDNQQFFQNVKDACKSGDFNILNSLFEEFTENVGSLQLALYLLMLKDSKYADTWGFPANAAWVHFADGGQEKNIFADDLTGRDDPRLTNCLVALELLEAHMRLAPEFLPGTPGEGACKYCEFPNLCWH